MQVWSSGTYKHDIYRSVFYIIRKLVGDGEQESGKMCSVYSNGTLNIAGIFARYDDAESYMKDTLLFEFQIYAQ